MHIRVQHSNKTLRSTHTHGGLRIMCSSSYDHISSYLYCKYIVSICISARCVNAMNHVGVKHQAAPNMRCKYQHQYENKVYLCKVICTTLYICTIDRPSLSYTIGRSSFCFQDVYDWYMILR